MTGLAEAYTMIMLTNLFKEQVLSRHLIPKPWTHRYPDRTIVQETLSVWEPEDDLSMHNRCQILSVRVQEQRVKGTTISLQTDQPKMMPEECVPLVTQLVVGWQIEYVIKTKYQGNDLKVWSIPLPYWEE
jgi:hypothetical protein